jgi:hypothetical protein
MVLHISLLTITNNHKAALPYLGMCRAVWQSTCTEPVSFYECFAVVQYVFFGLLIILFVRGRGRGVIAVASDVRELPQ